MSEYLNLSQPIACNLAAIGNRARYCVLRCLLQSAVSGRAELSDGFLFSVDGSLISLTEMGEWIGFERQCCPFLTLGLSVSGKDAIWRLTLTGPEGAKALLEQEFPG